MKDDVKCINGFLLKLIAIITMVIDHIGAILFPELTVLRVIGRVAFPIFIFLIVEGFYHTRSIRKYEIRMLIFAFISEIPFDLAFSGTTLEFFSQNVFFTLTLGLIMLDVMQTIRGKIQQAGFAVEILILVLFMAAAFFLKTDYDAGGILLFYVFYKYRDRPLIKAIFLLAISFLFFGLIECPSVIAMIPIVLYNGKRGFHSNGIYSGRQNSLVAVCIKYFFYLFYPLHLLVIHGIALLGMAE